MVSHRNLVELWQEWLLNLQMQNKGGNSTPGAEETAADLEKRRRAEQVDLLQRQFDARIDKVSHQINKQMNALINLMEQCRDGIRNAGPLSSAETRRASMESIISSNTAASSEQHNQMLKDVDEVKDTIETIDSQRPFKHQISSIEESCEATTDSSLFDTSVSLSRSTAISPVDGAGKSHRDASKDVATPSRPKATPLRHLLRDYKNITGPSIKFLTPMTDKRIERIRSLAADRTHSAPPKMYKVLPKLVPTQGRTRQSRRPNRKALKHSPFFEAVGDGNLGETYSSDEFSRSDDDSYDD
jgi:uncharacterized protein YukE